uniref:Uncharacterized protein n=1 Tax=Solanum lycopersicum TaxID=4081 RepID=K4C0S2_SOLLC
MIKNIKNRAIPLYTVHDNFISTIDFSHAMGESYIKILLNSPHPMEYINSFLGINLFDEARTPSGQCHIDLDGCFMYLLFKYAYPKDSEYGKFTIHYSMETTSGIITYALAQAITIRVGGVNQPIRDIVDEYVREKAQAYGDVVITDIFIRIYYDQNHSSVDMNISNDQISRLIAESVERRSFIVVDTETIPVESDNDQIEKVHMPYAMGFVVVKPGSALSKKQVGSIETYFCEKYLIFL